MKKPKTVIAAEAAVVEAKAALDAADVALSQRKGEYLHAVTLVRVAQTEADSALPQCDVVRRGWYGEKELTVTRAVIERQTPSGILVVRYVGDQVEAKYKFKWSWFSRKFILVKKAGNYTSDTRELRDVPPGYMPKSGDAESA